MTPNLFVATQTLFSPHKWFKSHQKGGRSTRTTEHWDSPVPGTYEYIPGRGWYLVATDKDSPNDKDSGVTKPTEPSTPTPRNPFPASNKRETVRMTPPVQVIYSKVLKRYLLEPDYSMRKKTSRIQSPTGKYHTSGFFRLDDGIAWVECWDSHGEFIPGPYKLWCLDRETGHFRHMLRGDDPNYVPSRQNSIETEFLPGTRRRSQDSRSTQFRVGPGSSRDGPSVPSTRANSVTKQQLISPPTSHPGSQPGSRRNSPKRSPNLPLEEAKVRLREMAKQQADAAATSRASDEDQRRGRSAVRSPDGSP